MKPRSTIPALLALVVVPIALAIAGTGFKTAVLSIGIFWICLAVFFYPNLAEFIKAIRERG
ncbi:hypothetical protein [Marinobacter arenosus]|uniref:hypothetical protein n=1 Tax=Marinobacter arenosus TaxID=2856822 RepID=UPI001C4C6DA7|nr:hypothetical protein [Marinobacter arenosus]MBW0148801.1 hypothetical protein [Marinobacter arenosus]